MSGWIGGFVNSALLAGLALASVPLIIHLLNRQRHRPMRWAAMRFVLAAYRKTRRRVQLENLILLLLRMAAVALLALAIARPFTGSRSPLAGLTESRRDVVLVIDGSASTGYRESVETGFEREVARAREVVRGLEGARGDRARLILAGAYPRLLSWTTPDQALSMLDTLLSPTDEPLDLAAALGEVLKFAHEDAAGAGASTLEVHLLTDLQRRAFEPRGESEPAPQKPKSEPADATPSATASATPNTGPNAPDAKHSEGLIGVLDQLAKLGLRVIVEDLGPAQSQAPNLGVGSIKPLTPILGLGIPADIAVSVQNHGPSAKTGVRVVLEVDGERRPNQLVDVPARGEAQVVFPVAFKSSGDHIVQARLEGDRLAVDDVRAEAVRVPPPIRVLLVNGAPAAGIDEDETGYLKAVLQPPTDDGRSSAQGNAPFEATEIEPERLGSPDLSLADYDVIWLANVESLSKSAADRLERRVAEGGALIVSLGDKVVPESYNSRLFRADGSGLLPAEIQRFVEVRSRREDYYRVKSFDAESPVLSFFADERWKPLFTEVPIYAFFAVRPLSNAHVLATLDDEGAHALLVERAYDRGKVLLWTTTIDPLWTRLPESPRTFVPLVHELLRHAAYAETTPRNVSPGEPLAAEVSAFPRNPQLVRPDGSRRPIEGEPERVGLGNWKLPPVPGKETEHVGAYKIEMDGLSPLHFAVQLDPLEGDLDRISPAEVDALHPAFATLRTGDGDHRGEDRVTPQRGELWRWVALGCLIALVLESLWAAWLGLQRGVRS
jgi:Aerotolerance regulator N-terminal